MKTAFLGLGAMGRRMAAQLVKAGHQVTVWNRTASAVDSLVAAGAHAAATPKAAAADAELIFCMVRDDEASRRVWLDERTGALLGMKKGTLAIECSTLSVAAVKSLAAVAKQSGMRFVDAPLAGSRPQAEAGQLIFFAGGEHEDVAVAEPLLKTMGASVWHVGPVSHGAAVKLMVNALFGIQLAAVAELIGLAQKSGLDVVKAVEVLGATPVISPAAKVAATAMLAENFAPMFPIELVAKDFGYALGLAASVEANAPLTEAASAVFKSALNQGHGDDNSTAVARVYW
jgi:3-hydroxyisobutyrate dehydrogenase